MPCHAKKNSRQNVFLPLFTLEPHPQGFGMIIREKRIVPVEKQLKNLFGFKKRR
jgi:hypothetical protein